MLLLQTVVLSPEILTPFLHPVMRPEEEMIAMTTIRNVPPSSQPTTGDSLYEKSQVDCSGHCVTPYYNHIVFRCLLQVSFGGVHHISLQRRRIVCGVCLIYFYMDVFFRVFFCVYIHLCVLVVCPFYIYCVVKTCTAKMPHAIYKLAGCMNEVQGLYTIIKMSKCEQLSPCLCFRNL